MSRYKAYPAYKDSGVEWLGEAPSHWATLPVGRLYQRTKRTNYADKELLSVYRDHGVVPTASRDDNNNKPSEDLTAYQLVEPDNLVMNKMKAWQGSIAISEHEGIVSPAYFVYEPNARMFDLAIPKYIHYLLRHPIYIAQYLRQSKGIRVNQWDLDPDEFKKIELLLPQKEEQKKIIDFLDHETAKIDALIEKQQRLIELLKEKRRAVISQAVTKGLNPNAPMKDSGVEWLGKVPAHWALPKIKWFFHTESGGTPNTTRHEEYYLDGTVPWIRTTDLNNGELFETPVGITEKAVRDTVCSLLPINSVLVAMYGGAGSIGKHALLKFASTINQAVCAILPNEKIDSEYLHLYIEFYRPFWMVGAEGTRKDPNINQDVIRELIVTCPTVQEQRQIVVTVKNRLSMIDLTVGKAESSIQLMQERRTALVSAAVSGKIDVRDWQPAAEQAPGMA